MNSLFSYSQAHWQKMAQLARRTPLSWLAFGIIALLILGGIGLASRHASLPIQTAVTTHKTAAVATPNSTAKPTSINAAPQITSDTTNPSSVSSTATTTAGNVSAALAIGLSNSGVTIPSGSQTPTFTATSTNGKPLSWTVTGNSLLTVNGLGGSNEVVHNFSFTASPAVRPGNYTYTITGYIPRGASVSKQVTITVTQGPTFTLTALPADSSNETATTFMVPFEIRPLTGALSNVSVLASVSDPNMSIANIEDIGSSYYNLGKGIVVYDNGQGSGHIIVRATVSDGVYTTSIDLPYDLN